MQTTETSAAPEPVLHEAKRETPQRNLVAAPKWGSTQTQPSCCFNWMGALMSKVRLMCSPSFAAHQIDSASFLCQSYQNVAFLSHDPLSLEVLL